MENLLIISACCHINVGAIVKASGKIKSFRKLEAREVVLGYGTARVKPSDAFGSKNNLSK